MNVLAFRHLVSQAGWNRSEMEAMAKAFAPAVGAGEASRWVLAETERGDPQVYLLGPEPDQDCILCISRIGTNYIVEDGAGGLLSTRGSMMLLAEQLRQLLCRRTSALAARIGLLWIAGRKAVEEKIEPIMAEPVEILGELAPFVMAV